MNWKTNPRRKTAHGNVKKTVPTKRKTGLLFTLGKYPRSVVRKKKQEGGGPGRPIKKNANSKNKKKMEPLKVGSKIYGTSKEKDREDENKNRKQAL